jgi:hypothetical protein
MGYGLAEIEQMEENEKKAEEEKEQGDQEAVEKELLKLEEEEKTHEITEPTGNCIFICAS